MSQLNNGTTPKYLLGAALPISLLAAQVYPIYVAITLIATFTLLALLYRPARKASTLISILLLGYLFWSLLYDYIEILFAQNVDAKNFTAILSRFGLIGYLLLLFGWYLYDKTTQHYFKIGSLCANIKIPCIWYGFNDNVLRVSGVFSIACIVATCAFSVINQLSLVLICMGIIFSLINAVLEELLWRGFVLNRLNDCYGEKIGLILMSLTFGVYHYSLGFTLPICLLFSLGGIYFGGIAIKSKGLLLATVMHFCMNMLFVSIGIIFK